MYLFLTLIYMSGILFSSLQPGGSGDPLWLQIVKEYLHVPAYAGLTYLWIKTLSRWTAREIRDARGEIRTCLLAFTIAVVYGIFNEYVQSFVPGRTCTFTDVWHNALGAGMMVGFVYFLVNRSVS